MTIGFWYPTPCVRSEPARSKSRQISIQNLTNASAIYTLFCNLDFPRRDVVQWCWRRGSENIFVFDQNTKRRKLASHATQTRPQHKQEHTHTQMVSEMCKMDHNNETYATGIFKTLEQNNNSLCNISSNFTKTPPSWLKVQPKLSEATQ